MTGEELVKVKQEVIEASETNIAEQFIKNNFFEFDFNDKKYRIRRPTFNERQKVFQERVRLWTELLKEGKFPLEAELKTLYLSREVDVDKMDEEIKNLEKKRLDTSFNLGKLLKDKAPESDCEVLKKEIEQLIQTQMDLTTKKSNLMQYTLETQVMLQTYTFLTVVVSEVRKEDGTWEAVFKTIEEFKNRTEDDLTNKLIMYVSLFIRHELEF